MSKDKSKVKEKVKVKVLEVKDDEKVYLQQVFLDAYLKYGKFTAACNVLQTALGESANAEPVAGQWIEGDEEFKIEFEKAKMIVDRTNALKAEEFLNEAGSGKKRKDEVTTGMTVASHMVLEAWDKQKWSPKVEVKKTETRNISVIIKHYGSETKVETIDAPEVKQLDAGNEE